MAFSSLLFLTLFLPVYTLVCWATPRVARNASVLGLSLVFYAWGAPRFIGVVLALGVIDFALARVIQRRRGTTAAKVITGLAVAMHLSVLAYFKYSNFLVGELSRLLLPLSGHPLSWAAVVLPIGISFLTFEEISYVVDAYRGHARPARSVPQYLLFLMLFPHSIAGPIFRWKDLEAQLQERPREVDDLVQGLSRFTWGLAKKILVADAAASTADAVFGANASELTASMAWLGALAYTIQIFYDFSGYSDMAIGLGRMAGFRFKENFNAPYISASITEFWTRWHISLSTWLRDYLYVPLGGNRKGTARTYVNILVVFALSGLWHGAAWTFMLWGVYHGLLTVLERTSLGQRWRTETPRWIGVPVTFVFVLIGWVLFRATSFGHAFSFLASMFGHGGKAGDSPLLWGAILPRRSGFFICFGLALVAVEALFADVHQRVSRWVYVALSPIVFSVALVQVVNTKFIPLIYFKF